MASLLCLFLSPALLVISLPLVVFAAFTTTFAFSTLFCRVLIVYAELAAVLVQNHFATLSNPPISASLSPRTTPSITDEKDCRHKSRRSSAGSGNSNGESMTPRFSETSGLGIYGSEGGGGGGGRIERDFEGVGGWRIPDSQDDDGLWTSMNSRLELPAISDERRHNHHHRSWTAGSLPSTHSIPRSLVKFAREPSSGVHAAGNASIEEYFVSDASSKATTALDFAKVGKPILHRNTSSASTTVSEGSSRTAPMKITINKTSVQESGSFT